MSATWAPVPVQEVDAVGAGAAAALHHLLDAPGPAPGPGEELPPLWHWTAFVPRVPQAELGPDGHPARGGFLPPVAQPRRMFAAAQLELHRPLVVGAAVERTSVVGSVTTKEGSQGPLVFVRIRHEHRVGGELVLTEHQDLVYLDRTDTPPRPPGGPVPDDPWRGRLAVDPTLLFRFSALTYNAHRIHYDRAYATGVEGYPGLVVHGPLQAVALAELCRRHAPGRRVVAFELRGVAPAFDDGPLHLRGEPRGDVVALRAFDHAGRLTMRATAHLGDR